MRKRKLRWGDYRAFNKTVRYDWLNQELFDSLEQVRQQAEAWLNHYNNERPNMGNGGFTSIQKLNRVACSTYLVF